MTEKRYCIICGNEILSTDPSVVFCAQHGGTQTPLTPTPQPGETTWEANDEAPQSQPLSDITSEWRTGQTLLDTYEVIGKLGEGGMGKVYRVHHKSWNIDLAVKQPKAEIFTTQKGKEAFIREAETWVDLGLHPHITSCYYVRTIEDIPHIFVEFMAGGSLEDWIQQKHYKLYEGDQQQVLQRILDIAIQFAWGLAYAHECNLVHQDVKPLNVLMTPEGIVKVTDFGLAKARAKAGESTGKADSHALVSGSLHTIAYRSPEQAKGALLSHKTDIWSWGVSVLQMFSGEVSWMDGQAAATSLEGFLNYGGKEGTPPMPADLADLLRQCFQQDPDARPDNMLMIAEQMQRIYQQVTGQVYPREMPKATELRADSLNNKALTMLDLERHSEAENYFQEALEANSLHPEANYNHSLNQWQRGEIDDLTVVQRLETVLETLPERWPVAYLLGLVHIQRGDKQQALKALQGLDEYPVMQRLKAQTDQLPTDIGLIRTIGERINTINSVSFTPDGHQILSGSANIIYKEQDTLRLWDALTGTCLRTFEGYQSYVNSVAISPDGRQALSGSGMSYSREKNLHLWNLETGKCIRTFEGHIYAVTSVSFSPDGSLGLSGGGHEDNTVRLWDLATGACIYTFEGHTNDVNTVAFSPNGRYALSGSEDKTMKLWDIANGKCLRTFEGQTDDVKSVAFSPDGRRILSGSGPAYRKENILNLWDLETGECLHNLVGHQRGVNAVAISPDRYQALSGSNDKTVKLWDLATGACLRTFEGFPNSVQSVTFSPDGRQGLSACSSTLHLWDLECVRKFQAPLLHAIPISGDIANRHEQIFEDKIRQAKQALQAKDITSAQQITRKARSLPGYEHAEPALEIWFELYNHCRQKELQGGWLSKTLKGHTDIVLSVVFSPDGSKALSGSRDKSLRLWDISTSACLHIFKEHEFSVNSVAFSPDGQHALSGSLHTLKLWDITKEKSLRTFEEHTNTINTVAFSPDGRYVLSASSDFRLKLWNPTTGKCLRTLEGHRRGVNAAAVSPDGCFVLSGSDDKTLKLWDVATGRCLRTFEGHKNEVNAVSILPNGREALSGSRDDNLKLWDLLTGRCLRNFEGFRENVSTVAFSPDGRHALSSSKEYYMDKYGVQRDILLWDTSTGTCVSIFKGNLNSVYSVAFSPDGSFALLGSQDKTLKLWVLDWALKDYHPADWDEGAQQYLTHFLTLHKPYGAKMPRSGLHQDEKIKHSLTRQGKSSWSETDFQFLLQTLGQRGYGWLRPEGVRQKLEELAAERS